MRNWRISGDQAWRVLAIAVVVYSLALRLYFAAHVQLLPEETYYWNYSRHLAIGYLDHPPMVAWLIRCGTALFGSDQFGVRIGAVVCGAVTGYFIYRLTRDLCGEASALLALACSQILPFFFSSGMLLTPDAPLTAAWAASLYFLERALAAGDRGAWWWAGICLGLGMLSKYTIGLLGLAALIHMIVDRRSRPWLARWQPYAAALLAFAIFSPVIVWNAEHHWVSFAFQTSRRLAAKPQFAFHKLLGGAIVLLTPSGFLVALSALTRRGRESGAGPAPTRHGLRLLRTAVWVPLAVFAAFSLRREVKLDWSGAPWVAALPLIASEIVIIGRDSIGGWRAWLRATCAPTIAALCLLYAAGLYHLAYGIPGLGYSEHIELLPVGWRQLGRRIDRAAQDCRLKFGALPLVVGMDRYGIASELAFYAPNQAAAVKDTSSAHLFGGAGLMYENWFPAKRQRGRTLLLVSLDENSLHARAVKADVETLGPIERGELMRGGHLIREYYYRVARGYLGAGDR